MWIFLSSTLYAIAKPNMIWEQQKILLLNDAEVISAVILKLKFPKENFESWLQLHNVNASRVFGTKVTFENEASSRCYNFCIWNHFVLITS